MAAQDQLKLQAARAVMDWLGPRLQAGMVLGVGTGSTVDLFIDLLAGHKTRFAAAVSSSERSTRRMLGLGIAVRTLDDLTEPMPFYIDGADEIDTQLRMIKGGGGALTREKIVASAARQFLCIADGSKLVERLGAFALPVEVVPMARAVVARRLAQMGGRVQERANFVTDNGGVILDVAGLDMSVPEQLETGINGIPGVVSCGLFALRGADAAWVAQEQGVRVLGAAA
jgi:ribose 5-phosphate isomerase A